MGATHKKPSQDDSNLEIYSLIWLDPTFHNNDEIVKAQQKLRISINYLKIFENCYQCEEYIRSVNSFNRFILIINDELARQIVPRIEQLRQVYSIYIHCLDKIINQQWAKQFLKIKCLSDQLDMLVTRIQSDHRIDDSFPVVIYNVNKLNFHFFYSQLLFDCLIRLNSNDKNKFIFLCQNEYKDNEIELNIIHEFEKYYSAKQSLSWYTRKSFIYRILNKALLIQNIDLLFTLRFFIQDIYQQIKENKCLYPIHAYHSHLMTYEEIQLIENSLGQYISINSFLSACLDRGLALYYLYEPNDLQRVLFEIDTDIQSNDMNHFGYIKLVNYCEENEQILFMLGSIFRIENIFLNDDEIWIIQMKLCTENDYQLKLIFNFLINEYNYGQENNIFSFGEFLIKQGCLNEVEKYYIRLIDEFSDHPDNLIQCYNELGKLAKDKHDYELSIQWFNKAIKIKPQNDSYLIESYNNIAEIYQKNGDYKQAIESYNKSLKIFIKIFGDDHQKLAICFNNIAIAYKKEKKYIEALEYHQKALNILEKYRSSNHCDLAASHNNIGVIHRHLGHYDLALEHYHNALEIYKKSLSGSYSDMAKTFRNIGTVHQDKGDLQQSLLCFKKSSIIYRCSLSSEHPDVMEIEEKIRNISSHLK
ncbi:unnamed protein product [Rotaria sp. Silwood1]|nr:unnamed protein product [Rotaria sp. Silwood1]CAF1584912.1 unnamed protein product [Rotaria sp. Silwood1]CAF3608012.1 unnamed protein product [Rotaria sp. Silwood1]CAF3755377.1 unnamed protein product [Rotaria sp. Silwood1]CAF4539483.1 unnamed protein product [Rotaria sp. Silwood1]